MGRWDRMAIEEFGIHGEILMENASREALHVLLQEFGPVEGKRVLLFAGSGNNGGDAFALARHLADRGARCLVLHTKPIEAYTGETAFHAGLAKKAEVACQEIAEHELGAFASPDIVVDGLLGTGFQGELRADYQERIELINRLGHRAFVLAIDIPSGLSGLTGRPGAAAVRAECTVSFEAAKLGLFLPEARAYLGRLHTRPIGIPATIRREHPPDAFGMSESVFAELPRLDLDAHKGRAGHVLIIGGSPGLTGATTLAALGALRSGAGLVTVASPASLCKEIKQGWPEIMTLPLKPGTGWSESSIRFIAERLHGFQAVVFGPGIGRDHGAGEALRAYLQTEHPPTLIDADGLFALAKGQGLQAMLQADDVITPHPGEMATLLGTSVQAVQSDRIAATRRAVEALACVVVLKGAGSIVQGAQTPVFISPFACPALAVGGSGDVLAGLIGSLLAAGLPSLSAARLGVYWHGAAGEMLSKECPARGNLAQDIAHALPRTATAYQSAHRAAHPAEDL
jgi:NAD(P)H-hydrate epimerase